MKLTEPFELGIYTVDGGVTAVPALVLGVETLRNDGDALFYAAANVTVSTRHQYAIKNPIAYKTLRHTRMDKVKVVNNPVLDELDMGVMRDVPRGLFVMRKSDGVFYYAPEYKRDAGIYVVRAMDELSRRAEIYSDNYGVFGRYQIGTHEHVIQALTDMDKTRGDMLMRDDVFNALKKILNERTVREPDGR